MIVSLLLSSASVYTYISKDYSMTFSVHSNGQVLYFDSINLQGQLLLKVKRKLMNLDD